MYDVRAVNVLETAKQLRQASRVRLGPVQVRPGPGLQARPSGSALELAKAPHLVHKELEVLVREGLG